MGTEQFRRCLRRIEVAYGADGWHDEIDPKLYALHATRGDKRLLPMELGVASSIWALSSVGNVLGGLSNYMAERPEMLKPFDPIPGGRWAGLALANEVWVAGGEGTDYEQLVADATAHTIGLRPDKRSARIVYGLTREMEPGFFIRYEDSPDVLHDQSDTAMPGGILHGLSTLVATIDTMLDNR